MTRTNIITLITSEVTDSQTIVGTNLADNVSQAITPTLHRAVENDIIGAINATVTELATSSFIMDTDTSDEITEGAVNLFATDVNLDAWLTGKTTTDLAEGTNLYYTEARTDARINTLRPTQAPVAQPTGGANIDAEARNAINNLIARLQGANIIG